MFSLLQFSLLKRSEFVIEIPVKIVAYITAQIIKGSQKIRESRKKLDILFFSCYFRDFYVEYETNFTMSVASKVCYEDYWDDVLKLRLPVQRPLWILLSGYDKVTLTAIAALKPYGAEQNLEDKIRRCCHLTDLTYFWLTVCRNICIVECINEDEYELNIFIFAVSELALCPKFAGNLCKYQTPLADREIYDHN